MGLSGSLGYDQDVVHDNEDNELLGEDLIDIALKGGRNIGKVRRA